MPKLSKATATSHMQVPGVMDNYGQETGEWSAGFSTFSVDVDGAPLFKGAPGDQCQASHLGYVLKGRMSVRMADGSEEVFEAGDAFFIAPGHIPYYHAGLEILDFTPTEDANRQLAVMAPNLKKYLEEHGMEVPAELQTQSS